MTNVPVPARGAERARSLARLLDSAVRIPGTQIRFGLDSLIGLVPGLGDVASGALSGYIVLSAHRAGVPGPVLIRMLLNLGLDTLVGTVPVLGDLFDVAFRANLRNADLLERYAAEPGATRKSSKWVAAALLGGVVLLVAGAIGLAIVAAKLLNRLAGA